MTKIFQHLSVLDLACCSLVCQTWNRVAERVKKKCTQLFWMCKVFSQEHFLPWNNPAHQSPFSCWVDSGSFEEIFTLKASDLGKHYFEVLQNAPSEPLSGFIFASYDILSDTELFLNFELEDIEKTDYEKQMHLCSTETYQAQKVAQFLSRSLPKPNNIVVCFCHKIVGTPPDNLTLVVSLRTCVGLTGVFIPKIPGVHVHQFIMTWDDVSFANITRNEIYSAIPDIKNIKCIINLQTQGRMLIYLSEIVQHFLDQTSYQLAFGGIMGTALGSCSGDTEQPPFNGIGLIFWGDQVSAASVVLPREVQNRQEIEEEIRKLWSANFTEDNTYCLMFANFVHNLDPHGEGNIECKAFKKVFPKVPLFGITGKEAYGFDYVPGSMQPVSDVTSRRPCWNHYESNSVRADITRQMTIS